MIGLSAVVVFTVLLPFAGASAGPADSEGAAPGPAEAAPGAVAAGSKGGAGTADAKPLPGRAHARCGPEVVSPEGVEAQTCVLTEGRDTWARTYFRNATGEELDAVLTLMGPAGRTVRMECAVGAEDEPGLCETPRGTTAGAGGEKEPREDYTAVSEFAGPREGPLLLRSGSNSAPSATR
ncbi:hypothetical protein ACFYVL_35690 [Streptomyces sp. NPDC004111]|uniref:hypothetical protein n=1 Tax=Streptomyces sp. NPDC004111 TaxID=3364690 RepID=UPI0036A0E556